MKKIITSFSVAALVAFAPLTALAQNVDICPVENCNRTAQHTHKGTIYSGHYAGDGHDYHQICNVQGCTKNGSHQHNGTTCLPHRNGDGHNDHNGGGHRSGGQRGRCHS